MELEIALPLGIKAAPLIVPYLESKIRGTSCKITNFPDHVKVELGDGTIVMVPFNSELKRKTINGIKLRLINGNLQEFKLIPGTGSSLEAADVGGVAFVVDGKDYDSLSELVMVDDEYE